MNWAIHSAIWLKSSSPGPIMISCGIAKILDSIENSLPHRWSFFSRFNGHLFSIPVTLTSIWLFSTHFGVNFSISCHNSQLTKNNNRIFWKKFKKNKKFSFKMAATVSWSPKFRIWFENFEGYFLTIWWFQTWLLCNVDMRLMFKQFDPYSPSNHRKPTKEINDMQFGKCLRKGCVIILAKVPTLIFVIISRNCSIQHLQKIISKLIYAKVCAVIAKLSKWKMFVKLRSIYVGLTFFSQLNLSEMLNDDQNQWPKSGRVKCSAVLALYLRKIHLCALFSPMVTSRTRKLVPPRSKAKNLPVSLPLGKYWT